MRGERIWWEQLEKLLEKPIGVLPEMKRPEIPIHSQDLALIREVARRIDDGGVSAIWAPYLTAESLALLARAIVVATVNRPKVALYSSDLAVPRMYRRLYGVYTPLKYAFPMREQLPYARTLHEVEWSVKRTESEGGRKVMSILLDGRRWRTRAQVKQAVTEARRFQGAVCLLRDGWGVARRVLESEGIPILHLKPSGDRIDDGWAMLGGYIRRLNNYSRRISVRPITVLAEASPFGKMERTTRSLLRASAGAGEGGALPRFVEVANQMLQNACFPLSFYELAARNSGAAWLESYENLIRSSLVYGCPDSLRGLVYRFLEDLKEVREYLSLNHPPKVGALKQLLLESGEGGRFGLLCASELESATLELWKNSGAAKGCAELVPLTREVIEREGSDLRVIVPGPPSTPDMWMLLTGVSRDISVMTYPWQAGRWNLLKKRARGCITEGAPTMGEEEPSEEEFEFDTSAGPVFVDPEPLGEGVPIKWSDDPASPIEAYAIETESGTFRYRKDALVPTVEVDKVVDREVHLLRMGDTILVRTDGNAIDTRRKVDEIAETNPSLAAAAERAAVWKDLLVAKWKAEGCTLPELRRLLFPDRAVSYPTFRHWLLDPAVLGPNNLNIVLLLTRLGLDQEQAEEVREDLRRYRGYRRRIYNHLYKMSRKAASLMAGHDFEEEHPEDDPTLESEFGLTLLALEELTSFTKITKQPELVEVSDD